LAGGVGPEIQRVSVSATFEALEVMLLHVDGEATAGGMGGAVQEAWAAELGAAAGAGLKAEQIQDVGNVEGGADGGEVDGRSGSDSGLTLGVLSLSHLLALFPCLGEFLIALQEDVAVAAVELGFGGDVFDGAVKADIVVIGDEIGDEAFGIVEGERHHGADALAFESLVPTFDLAVALGIIRRGADVGHAGDDVGIEHHEGHAAISFERVLAGESMDAFFFVLGEPVVARDPLAGQGSPSSF